MAVRPYDILIVDDDRASRLVLEHRLRKLGYTNIDGAGDGLEGLRLLVCKHYDLVFLDNNMPVLSGVEMLRRCRGVSILNATTVIMLTGRADDQTLRIVKDEALKLDDFMVKPVAPEVLDTKLARLGMNNGTADVRRNPDTGGFLSITLSAVGDVSRLTLFGCLHQDDRHSVKDLPDRVCLATTRIVVIDMRDVFSIDEFGIGMVLLMNGVACMAQKQTYLLLDPKTIQPRLTALGIPEIVTVIHDESQIPPGPGVIAA